MKHVRDRTIRFYDNHADELRDRYRQSGARDGDILLGLALADNVEHPRVLEIGCGYGREARVVLNHTPYYTGIDSSQKFIEQARQYAPSGHFICADAVEYDYPDKNDIVFAFAVLRHFDQPDITKVLRKVHDSLKPGGIFYISLNYGQKFEKRMRQDELGSRVEYLYNPALILKLAGSGYADTYEARDVVGGVDWFEIALRRTD
jgi:SAM-dependent methyltransferase